LREKVAGFGKININKHSQKELRFSLLGSYKFLEKAPLDEGLSEGEEIQPL
jgi:hypothetical protein